MSISEGFFVPDDMDLIMQSFIKYPRTPHLCGSRLQPGDETTGQISISSLQGGIQIWEEKIDGANAAISFPEGTLVLQSRGHVLAGGAREAQFSLFKAWASCHERDLKEILGKRYIMYGEWCYAKHTVFYDALPHYFLEFDIYDREKKIFLSTAARHNLLKHSCVVSVPVVCEGTLKSEKDMHNLLQASLYKTENWQDHLMQTAEDVGVAAPEAVMQTDPSSLAEGLYLKQEEEGRVIGRYKYVRADFLQVILESGSHWSERRIIPNQLDKGIDIFSRSSV